ncbi:MAG: ribonuclease HI [Myxococcales bacterium]|nr:ribonuclease HI [Myxococcales bacterium]
MPWQRYLLRDQEVFAQVSADGVLVTDGSGRVEIVYKLAPGAKSYRASAGNLAPVVGAPVQAVDLGTSGASAGGASARGAAAKSAPAKLPANAIAVWTDGACTGNPGPAGIGVVVIDGDKTIEASEYLGDGTNNIAELTAIARGLQIVRDQLGDVARPIAVYSDSAYAIGLLSKQWKAKANVELVAAIRELLAAFADVHFVKVAGHAGVPLNERCDALARQAVSRRR